MRFLPPHSTRRVKTLLAHGPSASLRAGRPPIRTLDRVEWCPEPVEGLRSSGYRLADKNPARRPSHLTFINEPERIFQAGIEGLMKKPVSIVPLPEGVVVSTIYTDEEKPFAGNKNYLKIGPTPDLTKGFQPKKEKNIKINQGGSYKRKMEAKYKKRQTRGNKP